MPKERFLQKVRIMRVTLAVVLSYLWEFCVFQSSTQAGSLLSRSFEVTLSDVFDRKSDEKATKNDEKKVKSDEKDEVGRGFPAEECGIGMDCFYTQLSMQTFMNRNHRPVNCTAEPRGEEYFTEQALGSELLLAL